MKGKDTENFLQSNPHLVASHKNYLAQSILNAVIIYTNTQDMSPLLFADEIAEKDWTILEPVSFPTALQALSQGKNICHKSNDDCYPIHISFNPEVDSLQQMKFAGDAILYDAWYIVRSDIG
jgi:hypothetical protein